MTDRKGVSFTLTVVVAGVILIMTALSVITLGGSGIQNFFTTIGQEQQEQVREADIREACNQLKQEISTNYCQKYVQTATYSDCLGLPRSTGAQRADYMNETQDSRETSHCRQLDQWESVGDAGCGTDQLSNNRKAQSQSSALGGGAYEETASQASCNWADNYFGIGQGPTVTVQGNQYNCLEKGYIDSDTCPVQ